MPYLRLLRPHQWVKNVFVFAALIFGQLVADRHSVLVTLIGFVLLCAASSTVYIINDLHDRAEDRLHPSKRKRPIASGEVSVGSATLLALVLLGVALLGGWWLSRGFGIVVAAYLVLQFGYTFAFKHIVILDVIAIGAGFVLRAIAGAALIDVDISHWLILCTFTLCLFMGFSKRRCELNTLLEANGGKAEQHRKTLALYTPDLLNHMTTLTAGIAIVTFMLYTVDKRTVDVFHTNYLLYTLPIVVYAVFRFALLVEHGEVEGPTDVVLKDRPFQAAIIVWLIAALLIVYRGREIRKFLVDLVSGG
jgi:4-hydroxybenzoate polyprenyltransferase